MKLNNFISEGIAIITMLRIGNSIKLISIDNDIAERMKRFPNQ